MLKITIFVLCILLFGVSIDCKPKGGRGGGGRSRGGSHHSSGGGHHSSSWSWGSLFGSKKSSSTGTSHGYPSSSSGLSGSGTYNSPSSSYVPSHSYPGSKSGLSGTGSSNNFGYPASTGLSGTGSGKSSYPASSSGLSGSQNSNYPPSKSGLSGTGSNAGYPSSNSGLSGNGRYSGQSKFYKGQTSTQTPRHTYYPTNSRPYGSNTGGSHVYHPPPTYYVPSYYSAPQHIYVTEYRNSGSTYSDLLTGLTLYNLGRTHSNHHDHYYYDDYYHRRYHTSGQQSQNSGTRPTEKATCRLKIKDDNKVETLNIPCEIVSTFTQDSKKTVVNTTVCVTNTTTVTVNNANITSVNATPKSIVSNFTAIENKAVEIVKESNSSVTPVEMLQVMPLSHNNVSDTESLKFLNSTKTLYNGTINTAGVNDSTVASFDVEAMFPSTTEASNITSTESSHQNVTTTVPPNSTVTPKITTVNVTTCTTSVNGTDPLAKIGPALSVSGKECIVEIQTRDTLFSNKVNCDTLLEYSKLPAPKNEERSLMPSREKLKSWLSNPPWWLSVFIAV